MQGRRRKVEVYRLTISGLPHGTSYQDLIKNCFDQVALDDREYDGSTKQHLLRECKLQGRLLQMSFNSYRMGHRPDIVNTSDLSLRKTPLKRDETGVEWTHCLIGKKHQRYYLVVERSQTGIWPSSIEEYLQWFLDGALQDLDDEVVVTLSPEPGPEFISRLEGMDRIITATYRIARPNPGWLDLEGELARESEDSDSRRTEVTMHARRGKSLSKVGGIIKAIRDSFKERRLDHAKIKGERSGLPETLDSAKLIFHRYINFRMDGFGQVEHYDAWEKMAKLFDEMS